MVESEPRHGHRMTIADAKSLLERVDQQAILGQDGVTGIGVGLRGDVPSLILSVRDMTVLKRFESEPPEYAARVGLPICVEIEHFTELGGGRESPRPLRTHYASRVRSEEGWVMGLWHRVTRPLRGISTLFVP
jgi:hypothetical protein